LGDGVVFEHGVLVFHPENVSIEDEVYVGHYSILKAYYQNEMKIGRGTWIGQQCFFHSAGGLAIGRDVGIGPGVKIITSTHQLDQSPELPIMKRPIAFAPVTIGDGCDIGMNAVILPGVTLGRNVQVGAGAVVTRSFPDGSIVKGIPAKS
jgi:acetyltransferase-like isoleucine patch superfamily enzyme